MLKLTDEQLDWLLERIPDAPRSPKGGRPTADKRKTVRGIFWILDNGAKWKDLPRRFGPKTTVHRWFQTWTRSGVLEQIMRDAGRLVEERDGYRVYECFVDGTFCKARGGGDGVGCTKAGKGVKIMVMVDAAGLPVAVDTTSASPHESKLVQQLFDFMLSDEKPLRVIGDKAYDSDQLAEELGQQGVELIAPHRSNRKPENKTQDGRALPQIQASMDRRTHHRLVPELPATLHPLGEIHAAVLRFPSSRMHAPAAQTGFGIGTSWRLDSVQHVSRLLHFGREAAHRRLASYGTSSRKMLLPLIGKTRSYIERHLACSPNPDPAVMR